MGAISGWLFAAMWFILAVYMVYIAFRESKFFLVLGGFFLFMAVWYALNELIHTVDMFNGVYSWIFRGVALLTLILCAIKFYLYKRSDQ